MANPKMSADTPRMQHQEGKRRSEGDDEAAERMRIAQQMSQAKAADAQLRVRECEGALPNRRLCASIVVLCSRCFPTDPLV